MVELRDWAEQLLRQGVSVELEFSGSELKYVRSTAGSSFGSILGGIGADRMGDECVKIEAGSEGDGGSIRAGSSGVVIVDNAVLGRGVFCGGFGDGERGEKFVVGDEIGKGGSCVGSTSGNDTFRSGLRSDIVASGDGEASGVVVSGRQLLNRENELDGGEGLPEVVVEEKRAANRLKRQKAKERKLRKQERQGSAGDEVPEWRRGAVKIGQYVAGVVAASDVDGDLKDSVKRKWIAKNKLQALEAERRVAVLEANSLEDEVKQYRTNVRAVTERNMVSIEKTHARLSVSDNVPMEDRVLGTDAGSRVQTVTSGASSQTISPDSSASQAEYRAAQKKILDQEAEIERLKLGLKKLGVSWEVAEFVDKQTWTLEDGELPERSREILDMLYPSGYGERGQPWCEGVPEKTWIIPG